MHVLRVSANRDGSDPIGQLCEASKAKVLLWCGKGTSNTVADTADYHMAMTLAFAYANEPEEMTKFLLKQKQKPGQYYIILWNVGRGAADHALEFELE
jgi:fructoselysine-6-P-deglycase FrlB-like protein